MRLYAIHASPNVRAFLRILVIIIAMALVLALTGAYRTSMVPFWPRLAYWIVSMWAGWATSSLCTWLVARAFDETRQPVSHLAACLLFSVPLTTAMIWGLTALWFGFALTVRTYLSFLLPVFVISLIASLLVRFVHWRSASPKSDAHEAARPAPASEAMTPPATFMSRLPTRLQSASLLAVSAEDHYLRVQTEAGDALILMRLSDALTELAGLDGAQTHRSWWVARPALASVHRDDGRVCLILTSGLKVPVSRSHQAALKARGWL